MKITAHELAEILRKTASALKRGPDVEVTELYELLANPFPAQLRRTGGKKDKRQDLPLALSALLSLSTVDKGDWIGLIADLGLNVDVRPRDASRDILGKVLRVLESEPLAREKLQQRVRSKDAQASPELAKALSSLLS